MCRFVYNTDACWVLSFADIGLLGKTVRRNYSVSLKKRYTSTAKVPRKLPLQLVCAMDKRRTKILNISSTNKVSTQLYLCE